MVNAHTMTQDQGHIPPWEPVTKVLVGLVAAAMMPGLVSALLTCVFLNITMLPKILAGDTQKVFSEEIYILATGVFIGFWAVVVAAAEAVALGLPAVAVGLYLKLIRWWSSILAGSLAGIIPAIFAELSLHGSSEANGVKYMIDGVRTFDGWIQFGEIVLFMGFMGMVAGFTFWLTWQLLSISFQHLRRAKQ